MGLADNWCYLEYNPKSDQLKYPPRDGCDGLYERVCTLSFEVIVGFVSGEGDSGTFFAGVSDF